MRPTTEDSCGVNLCPAWLLGTTIVTNDPPPHKPLVLPKLHQRSIRAITHAKNDLQLALSHSLASSNLKGYGHTVKQYLKFCDKEKIPRKLRWPANKLVLCSFAASHTLSERLAYVVNGITNLAPPTSIQAPRPPVTRAMLQALYNGLDLAEPFHTAVFTAACDAFWGQCSLGELLCNTLNTFDARRHLTTASYTIHTNSATITLPWMNTKKGRGEVVTLAHQIAPLDPATTHTLHWTINQAPIRSHLYAYTRFSTFVPLTKSVFLHCCNKIWADAGHPQTTGHSFQIGGTTELLLAGVPPDVVKAMGHWNSDAFLVYWRSLNELAPLHTADLPIQH
ncbi:hypothetical protein K439DRAFT_1647853 [Ramaria rubella]|nr:hypothetical protein K439DRAFT_1647853 [Ramaria rubella]